MLLTAWKPLNKKQNNKNKGSLFSDPFLTILISLFDIFFEQDFFSCKKKCVKTARPEERQ